MRIVSIWLPRWPILRFLTAQAHNPSLRAPVDPDAPFVLSVESSGGARIAALNAAAEAEGLGVGDRLADARARVDLLQVRDVKPAADDDALHRLALWAMRYTPTVSVWNEENGADGFFLDITGGAHLFGGERALLTDLKRRLARFGLPARLAIASTAGAAWALAHFHSRSFHILPSGEETEALAPLPIEALRLSRDNSAALRRLGFKRVGALIGAPRAPFGARFEAELLTRLDQALGVAFEPLIPVSPPPAYRAVRRLLEPIVAQDAILAVTERLMDDLIPSLERDGVGARALKLALYRVDGGIETIDIGLSTPTRSVPHVTRLFALKFERIAPTTEGDFGFETLTLTALAIEKTDARQGEFVSASDNPNEAERCLALVDALQQRIGAAHVRRLASVESHIPERAEQSRSAAADGDAWPDANAARVRPILLFSPAEEARVMGVASEESPRRFFWRGKAYGVSRLQGSERIADEWWRNNAPQPTRDYYLAEDENGRRFWLFREAAIQGEPSSPRWFVHGLFA